MPVWLWTPRRPRHGAAGMCGYAVLLVLCVLLSAVGNARSTGASPSAREDASGDCALFTRMASQLEGAGVSEGVECCDSRSSFCYENAISSVRLDGVHGVLQFNSTRYHDVNRLFVRVTAGRTLDVSGADFSALRDVTLCGGVVGAGALDLADAYFVHVCDMGWEMARVVLEAARGAGNVELEGIRGCPRVLRLPTTDVLTVKLNDVDADEVYVANLHNVVSLMLVAMARYKGHMGFADSPLLALDIANCPAMEALPSLPDELAYLTLVDLPIEHIDAVPYELYDLVVEGVAVTDITHWELPASLDMLVLLNLNITALPPWGDAEPTIVRVSGTRVRHIDPVSFWIDELELHGNLLEGVPSLVGVMIMDISANRMRKSVALEHLTDLVWLDFSENAIPSIRLPPNLESVVGIHGALEAVENLPASLSDVLLAGNRLTTFGPVDHLANLRHLDVSNNQLRAIEGDAFPASLTLLYAHDNELESVPRLSTVPWAGELGVREREVALSKLDISNNRLRRIRIASPTGEGDLSMEGNPIMHSALVVLAVGNNQLESWADVRALATHADELVSIHVQNNKLQRLGVPAGEPLFDTPVPLLGVLDISHNAFSGPLPPLPTPKQLAYLSWEGSGFRAADACAHNHDVSCLGSLQVTGLSQSAHSNVCPQLEPPAPWVSTHVDDFEYHGGYLCMCSPGHVLVENRCTKAPPGLFAPGGLMQDVVIARQGYWLHAQCVHVALQPGGRDAGALAARCAHSRALVCSPNAVMREESLAVTHGWATADAFPACADGHTGRMCGACVAGHYANTGHCSRCPPRGALALHVMWHVVVWIAFLAAAYTMRRTACLAWASLVWSLQLVALLGRIDVPLTASTRVFARIFESALFDVPALECMEGHHALDPMLSRVIAAWVGIVACGVVVAAVYAIGRAVRSAPGTDEWRARNVHALFMLWRFWYVPACAATFAMWRTERDLCTGDAYFVNAPHLAVASREGRAVQGLAWPLWILFVVGFPLVHALPDRRLSRHIAAVLADHRAVLRTAPSWLQGWPAAAMALTGLVAGLAVASLDRDALVNPIAAMAVLLGVSMAVYVVRPLANTVRNELEYVVWTARAIMFALLVPSAARHTAGRDVVAGGVVIAALASVVAGVLGVVRGHKANL